jgi:hypothetical protein
VYRILSRVGFPTVKLPEWTILLAALCAASMLSLAAVQPAAAQGQEAEPGTDLPSTSGLQRPEASSLLYLPALSSTTGQAPLCRLGINVTKAPVAEFKLSQLRTGWYIDYRAHVSAAHPNGAAYMPVISLEQVGDSDYASSPSGSALDAAIADNLGADWIIGNEPDRRFYQNDMVPAAYARAYHDLYHYIKAKDPRARIFAGAIVQPTPLRLQYLDLVLQNYWDRYGEAMPVDGWAIHNFILNERSCAHYNGDPFICWGADIPPGIDATDGLIIGLDELEKTADVAFFSEQVIRFRQWMADNGYRNRPLYVSEFGILMPEDRGFPPAVVNDFMTRTFDFLLAASDENLGYPADKNRLVQRLAWYSTLDPSFNGSLFQSTSSEPLKPPFELTAIGRNYREYAEPIALAADFQLLDISQKSPVAVTGSAAVSVTLAATVSNAGNNQWPAPAVVNFYLGDPAAGGVYLGAAAVALSGCGQTATAEFVWQDVPASAAGQYVYARLAGQGDATLTRVQVVIVQNLLRLPFLRQAWQ